MIQTIILGIIQGFTEFLPVSSSGHLALFERIFNINSDTLYLETAMHLGTLFSLLVFFRNKIINILKDAYNESRNSQSERKSLKFIAYIIIGIIPAALAGLFLYDHIVNIFHNMIIVGILFLITGIILYLTKFCNKTGELNAKKSIFIGLMQVFALLPGISRSGMTISTGVFAGVDRKHAADFSFFMAMPLILASFIKEFMDSGMRFSLEIIVGIIVSFLSGYVAIIILYKILGSKYFFRFSYYLIPLGICVVIYGSIYI